MEVSLPPPFDACSFGGDEGGNLECDVHQKWMSYRFDWNHVAADVRSCAASFLVMGPARALLCRCALNGP
eukprot:15138260-Ditylum_brightwellii.AAC.1